MFGKIRKVTGIAIILTALLVTQIPVPTSNAAGATDFQMNNRTLVKYTGTANTVSVSDTVKAIGEEAFAGDKYLERISFGKNVKEIGSSAFSECTYLENVKTNNNLKTIDDFAFSGCKSLKSVNIGPNVETIGIGVFAGCDTLKSIAVSAQNRDFVFYKGALYSKDMTVLYAFLSGNPTTVYTMPKTVERICPYAFWGNNSLKEVILSPNLAEIPGYAFSNCKNLNKITLPYSVRSIDSMAFENCISLSEITIPASVTYIDDYGFAGCMNLNIISTPGTVAQDYKAYFEKYREELLRQDALANVYVPSVSDNYIVNVETEGVKEDYGFDTMIDASTDPSNVEYMPSVNPLVTQDDASVVGKTVVVGGRAVLFLKRGLSQGTVQVVDTEPAETEETIYDSSKGGYLPKYAVLEDKIASYGFYGDHTLKTYNVPSSVEKIGDYAFANSTLESIVIGPGTKEIGQGAFLDCKSLQSVEIPGTVQKIEINAFDNSPWFDNWKQNSSDEFLIVGDGILLGYRGNKGHVNIPEGIKTIGPKTFSGHTELESVTLPESLICVAEEAFSDCINLKYIQGGNNLQVIEDRGFKNCPITEFVIPDSVTHMGLRAIDFSKANINKSVLVFAGTDLPEIIYNDSSARLSNDSYRNDVICNVDYVVVDSNCNAFQNTVLDNDKLGFSGLVLSIEKDAAGNETGYMNIRNNGTLYKDTVASVDSSITLNGKEYSIRVDDTLHWEETVPKRGIQKEVNVISNTTGNIKASFTNEVAVGDLHVEMNQSNAAFEKAYEELFGNDVPTMDTYSITLRDETDTVNITNFGQNTLTVTVPLNQIYDGGIYHVVCLDDDGQLEEVESFVNKSEQTISFMTEHLSEFAVYSNKTNQVSLSVEDGLLKTSYRKDASPDTGDNSIPVTYVIALGLACTGLCVFFLGGKRIRK